MDLAALAVAALLHLRPTEEDRSRLERFGHAIAAEVVERDRVAGWLDGAVDPLPARGPRARERAVLALVAIAQHESGLRAEVADCRVTGDVGQAFTAFQLRGPFAFGGYSVRRLCRSPRLAARRALAVFARHGRCGEERAFHGYASGSCSRPSAAARRQIAIWRRLMARFGVL